MRRASRAALGLLLLGIAPVLPANLYSQSDSKSQTTADSNERQSQPERPAQPDEVYQSSTLLRATTRLVLVDVIAKDANGKPLTDLTTDDFTITEGGKPQKIKVFSFQQPEQAKPAIRALPPPPPNVFSNVPRYKPGGAFNVILMDGLNSAFEHVADMRRLTLDFLRKLSRDEPVAVYGLNKRLELLQDFTSAADAQQAAGSSHGTAGGTFDASKFREVPASELQVAAFRANTESMHQPCLRVLITLKALHWIANSLAGFPGRKNLIWISDNFPFDIYTQTSQIPGTCLNQYSGELSETAETMLDNQIAIYPVVAGGLENTDFQPSATVGTHGLIGGPGFGAITAAQLQSLANLKTLISNIAAKTGGEAFSERNDLDMAIRKSIDDGSTYYTLGYYPENKKWDGSFRGVSVKVNREGAKLRYRLGYFATTTGLAKTDSKSRGEAMNEALDPQAPSATSLPFESTFQAPSQRGGNALVKFAIDPRGVTFEKEADGLQHASVDCVVKAYSIKGNLVKTRSSTMNTKLSPETFSKIMKTSFPCEQTIDLAPGSYVLHVGVIDNHTGVLGTASGKVTVF